MEEKVNIEGILGTIRRITEENNREKKKSVQVSPTVGSPAPHVYKCSWCKVHVDVTFSTLGTHM